MKRIELVLLLLASFPSPAALAAEKPQLATDTYSGYFVSNKFEPNAPQSFVVIVDQEQFDRVFGVAAVMEDKSHRLPKDAFQSLMVLAVIKRGPAVWEYRVQDVTEKDGLVVLRYSASFRKSETASFASPLIVSIPKGNYKAVQFVENKKAVSKVDVPRPRRSSSGQGSGNAGKRGQ